MSARRGAGVAQARVAVLGARGDTVAATVSDAEGRFVAPVPSAGDYRVVVRRISFEPGRAGPVRVGEHDTARVTVRMRESAVLLMGVTATVQGRNLPVKGRFRPSPEPPLETDHPTVSAGRHTLLLRGKLGTPSFCYRLASAAARTGQELIVVVEAYPNGDECGPSMGTAFRYDVTVKRLRPGTYALKLLHTFRGEREKAVLALDTTVVVH